MEVVISTHLPAAELESHALALRQARQRRQSIEPLTDRLADLSVSDAYAIASLNVQARLMRGARLVGHKIGLTAPAVQAQLGVDQPDYGSLLDEMGVANGAVIDAGAYIAPRIELEIAFILSTDLRGPGVAAADVPAATGSVHAAFELVDSRIRDWRIRLADTIADAASSAAFVLNDTGAAPDELDLADLDAALSQDGELIESGHSSAVLGDPCAAVAWLANALAEQGEQLRAGQVVLSGACTKMVPVRAGQLYSGTITGLGEVALTCAPASESAS
jgi:2-keto-4-pentenoate hydratase